MCRPRTGPRRKDDSISFFFFFCYFQVTVFGLVFFFSFYQDTIDLLQARVSALDSSTLDQVEARLQVTTSIWLSSKLCLSSKKEKRKPNLETTPSLNLVKNRDEYLKSILRTGRCLKVIVSIPALHLLCCGFYRERKVNLKVVNNLMTFFIRLFVCLFRVSLARWMRLLNTRQLLRTQTHKTRFVCHLWCNSDYSGQQ